MISEVSLQRLCGSVVLNRARTIQAQGLISDRSCQYRSGVTQLDAHVSSERATFSTHVSVDENRGVLVGHGCTCPAGDSSTPCKHAAALVLDFNRQPDAYVGHSSWRFTQTTPCLREYLSHPTDRRLTPAFASGGAVSLELTLTHDGPDWSARFRVVGPSGGYVVRELSQLCADAVGHAVVELGERLSFVCAPESFDEPSRPVFELLRRVVGEREGAVTGDRRAVRGPSGAQVGAVHRDLALTPLELADLIDLYAGREVFLREGASGATRPRRLRVVDADPDVGIAVERRDEGCYELVRTGDASFVFCEGRLYAWDDDALYRCSDRMAGAGGFLAAVYCNPARQLLVGKDDVALFSYELMPRLRDALGTQAPEELEHLLPRECHIAFYLDKDARGVTGDVRARYGDASVDLLTGRGEGPGWDRLVRDFATERHASDGFVRFFPASLDPGRRTEEGLALIPDRDDEAIARLVFDGLPELSRLGEVYTTPAFDRLASGRRPSVSVGLSVRLGLVDLSIKADDLPQAELYELLSSYHRRRTYHRMRDGSFVDLRGLDLSHVENLVGVMGLTANQVSQGEVELPRYRAFLLDDVTDSSEQDPSFVDYLEGFRSVDPGVYDPPESLAHVLRPYQVTGFRWLSSLVDMGFGGILADEMGLGKSVQLISLLLARRDQARLVGPSLIVCPASLVFNWVAEFRRFAPDMDVVPVTGSAFERQRVRDQSGHEVLVTSYELLRRDISDYSRMRFWSETLDEAQFIKNHTTLSARSVKRIDAEHRFALTGTPIENRLSELWSIFDYLMPGLLGSYSQFGKWFEQPIVDGDDAARRRLAAAVAPFVLRRLKSEVLDDLPDKLETVVLAHLEGEQSRLYAAQEQALRERLVESSDDAFGAGKLNVLADLMRLRQICCDPRLLYDDYRGPSAKLDAIMDLIDTVLDSQQKMLVFSQFTSYLDLIVERLERAGVAWYRIDGSTPKRRRLDLVDAFNGNDVPVFLISLQAGGTGLNLTGASVVIHADPWWNAAAQNQATDRAHRIGQKRDVTVYKVIAKDTIEERILTLQRMKSDLADQIMNARGASISSLSKDDLIRLLSHE